MPSAIIGCISVIRRLLYWNEKRISFESSAEGVYVFIYHSPESKFPERDYLQDNWQMAREFCIEDLGVPSSLFDDIDWPAD